MSVKTNVEQGQSGGQAMEFEEEMFCFLRHAYLYVNAVFS